MENLLTNPENITFAILFVSLLVWVMKKNEERENNYRETIGKLTTALMGYEDVKEKVSEIYDEVKKDGQV